MSKIFITIIIVTFCFCGVAPRCYPQEQKKGNKDYQIKQFGEYGAMLQIFYKGKIIYEITPRYADKILPKDGLWGDETGVQLIYEHLAPRGSLQQQPRAFDDVTGDGLPDIVVLEMPPVLVNSPMVPSAVRLLSLIGEKVKEGAPYFGDVGEMIHFDDYNHDGIFELINTDDERNFVFSQEGLPASDSVLIFDKLRDGYRVSK